MKEPRTDLGKALILITMPLRIIGWIVCSMFTGMPR